MKQRKPQRHQRLLGLSVLAGLVLFASMAAEAACPGRKLVPAPTTLNVDPTVPVGSIIGQSGFVMQPSDGRCMETYKFAGQIVSFVINGVGTPNGNLYPTTIPGVSYRAKMTAGGGSIPRPEYYGMYWPVSTAFEWVQGPSEIDNSKGAFTLEFIKTGPLSAGGSFGPQVVGTSFVNGIPYEEFYMNGAIILVPENPSCTITQSAINVQLPDASQTALNAAGKTYGDTPFIVPMHCKSNANLSLFFSGEMANTGNAVFKNTNSGSAANVGVQILQGGNPIPIGAGNPIAVGTVGPSGVNPAFTARYYALTSTVPTGDVSAIAYATLVYN